MRPFPRVDGCELLSVRPFSRSTDTSSDRQKRFNLVEWNSLRVADCFAIRPDFHIFDVSARNRQAVCLLSAIPKFVKG